MVTPKNIKYYQELQYNVILKKLNNYYYLFIPELSLIVEDKNLIKAYKKLEEEKEKYFRKIIELDASDKVVEPTKLVKTSNLPIDLLSFIIKIIVVFIIFLFIIISSFPLLIRKMNQLPNVAVKVIFNYADRFTKLPEEDKDKLRLKLHDLVSEIKPLTDEIKILWQDDSKVFKSP